MRSNLVRRHLNLELSDQAYKLLEQLAASADQTMADVLRKGLALYGIAQEASRRGQALGLVEDGEVRKEIIVD